MRRFSTLMLATACAAYAAPSLADDLNLTIYSDNRALISDSRDIAFKRGETTVELPGVSSMIEPTTVTFVADDIDIMEQNFDFDLLSPSKLMEKAVGSYVELVRTNPGTGKETRDRAKVLSVNNGVIVQIGQQIEVLRDDDIPTRVIFDKVPENLRANPTLSVMVDSARSGTREASLTYLTRGLGWRADYVAVFDEDNGKMDLQGWSTLTNSTKTTFNGANVSVVAGNIGNQQQNQYRRNRNRNNGNMINAGTEGSDQERIGDNLLYPLPGKITVKANQTKQVGIVDGQGVDAAKIYDFRVSGFQSQNNPVSAAVRIAFSNSKAAGLGEALPRGTMRIYSKDQSGRAQFIGEDNIANIPAGSDMAIKIGEAFDINVKPTVVKDTKSGRYVRDVSMQYEVTNASKKPVTVTIRNRYGNRWMEHDIRDESVKSYAIDAYTRAWDVKVPAEGKTMLTFDIRETRRR